MGSRVQGRVCFKPQTLMRVQGLGLRAGDSGNGIRALSLGIQALGLGLADVGFKVQGLGFGIWALSFGAWGSGFEA